jgi:opacity protein-like surface antigen
MKRALFVITVAALLAAWAALASAQPERKFMVTGGVGYAKLSEFDITAINGQSADNVNPTPDGSIAVGGGILYKAMPDVAVGAEVYWLNFGTQTIDGSDDSYYAVPVTGQVLYSIPTSSAATPFLTGGAGLYHLRNKVEGVSDAATKNVFGFNVGGGLKMESDMNVAFGLDARFHMALSPELTFGSSTFETDDWKMFTVMAKIYY